MGREGVTFCKLSMRHLGLGGEVQGRARWQRSVLTKAPGCGGGSMARSRKARVDCRSTAEKNEEQKRGSSRWTSQD